MSKLPEMLKYVDQIENEIVKLEQALVQIPSVNTGFMPTGNETPVCEFIKTWLEETEIDCEILEATPTTNSYQPLATPRIPKPHNNGTVTKIK